MHIHYDIAHEDCLAVRIFPLDNQAHFVEITLLAYHADGTQCWLPPEVRKHSTTHCGIREDNALKQATSVAAGIVDLLQAMTDPQEFFEAHPLQRMPVAA